MAYKLLTMAQRRWRRLNAPHLVGSPAVILADEPTGALDTRTAAEIMAFPQQLNVAQGVTVVVVTHEPEVAVYAQRILLVRHGRLVQDGTPEQVLSALPTRAA